MATSDSSPLTALIMPIAVFSLWFYQKRAAKTAQGPKPIGRSLGELMEVADRLERERREHPTRFALQGLWMAVRSNFEPVFAVFIAAASLFYTIGIRNSYLGFTSSGLGWAAWAIPFLEIAVLGIVPWLVATGRLKLTFFSGVLITVSTTIILMVSTSPLTRTAAERDLVGSGEICLIAATGFLTALARRLPEVLGLEGGVTGKSLDITETSSPRLHALVKETAAAVNLPMPRRTLVAEQTSMANLHLRFGPGGRLSELRMGVEDLETLTEAELRAVIAHELEHQHHYSTLHQALHRGLRKLRSRALSANQLKLAEDIELHLCVRHRENERSSDHASTRIDAAMAAQALTRIVVRQILFERVFSEIERLTAITQEPPKTSAELEALIESQPWYPTMLNECRAVALLAVTLPGDTHPVLHDRLRTMGQPPPTDLNRRSPSAVELLDARGADFVARHHEAWRVKNTEAWTKSYARLQADKALLDDPENTQLDQLTTAQLRKRAGDLWTLRSRAEALPAFEAYLSREPDDVWAQRWTAQTRAELGQRDAEETLIKIARDNPEEYALLRPAATLAYLDGRESQARELWREMLRLRDLQSKDKQERDDIPDTAPVQAHALKEPALSLLTGTVADYGVIKHAHLVRRKLSYGGKQDQHVVVLTFWKGEDGRYENAYDEHRQTARAAVIKVFKDSELQAWAVNSDSFPLMTRATQAIPGSKLK